MKIKITYQYDGNDRCAVTEINDQIIVGIGEDWNAAKARLIHKVAAVSRNPPPAEENVEI